MTNEDTASQGQEVRTMPFAAYGCDLARGRIDAVMYMIGAVLAAIIIALGG